MRLKQGCSGTWIAAAAAIADQITKAIVRRTDVSLRLGNLFALRRTHNTGAAFSMLSGSGLFLTVVTAVLIAAVMLWLVARPNAQPKWARAGLWLVAGGGLGNLYDRIVYGAVTDFIEPLFVRFAVFNIADIAIVCGAFIAACAFYIDEKRRESRS